MLQLHLSRLVNGHSISLRAVVTEMLILIRATAKAQ
jgi:hypothetical protein